MRILLLIGLLFAMPAWADNVPPPPALGADAGKASPEAPPPPPPLPAPPVGTSKKQSLEPKVTIIQRQHTTIEEYRINGRLSYVKIIPAKGFPYYLIDTNGDGILDTRSDSLSNPPINQWILFQW